MTTHEDQTMTGSQVSEAAPSGASSPAAGQEQSQASVAPADHAVVSEETTPRPEAATTSAEPTGAEREVPTAETLFGDDELAELRARWAGVQAAFVDDPKDCVQKADVLVSDLVEQLTTGFAQARSHLEEQWAQGQEASTEDLRLALMHYREFFERLLAV
ncbi:hypothetical protein A5791_10650 [Mycobacterium sp. 852002-51163_SCH5372311]|uniref:hypothetical protein n=1 Tax=Mycobacterium sp. 852002-51163_SCH5372311 TaxID=1834097 RepID=UPI0007FBF918|nr:hypothetical protein [Mycobacterium sp. 852002-51163_SCH5372311]OBF79649.1 hypothetical protein A5791_10650 [Mycobacterium sp. 852002-51163_SCH5372311]